VQKANQERFGDLGPPNSLAALLPEGRDPYDVIDTGPGGRFPKVIGKRTQTRARTAVPGQARLQTIRQE